jgi:hypothetical protein
MPDNADPRHGWPADEVAATPCGAASADIYGKLHSYLRKMVASFLTRLNGLGKASFKLLQVDAASLPQFVEPECFDRIEVSNISDQGWLGIHRTLFYMIPLLQNPIENPHATLITLFMNAVEETMTDEDKIRDMTPRSTSSRRLLQYIPPQGGLGTRYDPKLIKFNMGRDLVTKYDFVFDRYVQRCLLSPVCVADVYYGIDFVCQPRYCDEFDFRKAGQLLDAVMKVKHTIIDKWPFRLKLRPGQAGAQEEFDQYLSGGLSSKERYVEWMRTG